LDFSARFDCKSRTYRYYFSKPPVICINKMRRAAQHLVGEHDFRNFAKLDPMVNSFVRKIHSIKFSHFRTILGDEIWVAEIKGTAFLWHQIRFTMAVLFLVGRGFEDEDISWLLNKDQPKPTFDMASELGLVLWNTQYDLEWTFDKDIIENDCTVEEAVVDDVVVFPELERGKPCMHDVAQFSRQHILIELALQEAFIEKYSLTSNRSYWGTSGGLTGQSGMITNNMARLNQLPSVRYKTLRKRC